MEAADSEISSLNRKAIILHVEDEPGVQQLYRLVIEQHLPTVQVVSASGPAEAFAILEKTRPDLIITDIMMPNMDGLELIRLLKADPEWRSIPIAVGSAAAILRDQAYELGIVDLVEHPCTPERLIEMITRALQI